MLSGMSTALSVHIYCTSSREKEKAAMKSQRDRSLLRWRLSNALGLSGVPSRIKFFISIFLLVFIIAVTRSAAKFMGWQHPASESTSPGAKQGYTVVINTFKRNDLLKKTVAHYASCGNVDAIRVVWSERDAPPDSLRAFLQQSVTAKSSKFVRRPELWFDINEDDDLNNRFKPIKALRTDAVFSVDDDVVIACDVMNIAFSTWLSAPESMVGFVPRMHWLRHTESLGPQEYTYGGWWSVWWTGSYSMILTKAAFIHKKYLDMYTNELPASIRAYTKAERNCEDIAMSFLVANATGAPPIWVRGKVLEIGSTGISSLQGHNEHRSRCVNRFVPEFGCMPLVETRVKVVDGSHQWWW